MDQEMQTDETCFEDNGYLPIVTWSNIYIFKKTVIFPYILLTKLVIQSTELSQDQYRINTSWLRLDTYELIIKSSFNIFPPFTHKLKVNTTLYKMLKNFNFA